MDLSTQTSHRPLKLNTVHGHPSSPCHTHTHTHPACSPFSRFPSGPRIRHLGLVLHPYHISPSPSAEATSWRASSADVYSTSSQAISTFWLDNGSDLPPDIFSSFTKESRMIFPNAILTIITSFITLSISYRVKHKSCSKASEVFQDLAPAHLSHSSCHSHSQGGHLPICCTLIHNRPSVGSAIAPLQTRGLRLVWM